MRFLQCLSSHSTRRSLSSKPPYQHPTNVSFYYDSLCPSSWLAYEILLRYRPVWALELSLHPVSLKQIHEGNKVPSLLSRLRGSPNYSEYYFSDVSRRGEMYKVPIHIPESPFYLFGASGSDNSQQFLLYIHKHHPELLEEASRQLWYRVWSEDMDANKAQSLQVIAERIGLSEEETAEALTNVESFKDSLSLSSSEAIENGAFDLPFILINPQKDDREAFVGSNCFELMAHRLRKTWKGPIPNPEEFEPIREAPESDVFVSLEVFDKIQEEAKKVDQMKDDEKSQM
uniref:Glutathione S-transferase kappa 1 n=1 Tax=Caligus rogercresseyi TaxID=217165 RepID=C1BP92_CALRO|nr:Glutathione S-transferase kappa 1 [Caligus rogercresseyi]